MSVDRDERLWMLVHAERQALAADLASLDPEQWHHGTLCGAWDVEQVVAHLSAAACTGRWAWIRSMALAGFRPEIHNLRRLREQVGATPGETLGRFHSLINSTIAPTGDIPAYPGEVVVHAQDIRRALGLSREPSLEALTMVAEFYAARNFAVPSKSNAAGLRLKATDGVFSAGNGPLVRGSTLALVMAMAGRAAYLAELKGPGADIVRERVTTSNL